MNIGTHNSWSFGKCQWWLRPFAFMGRCQNKTIQEQFEAGARLFDLRVRFANRGFYACHGIFRYTTGRGSPKDLRWLNRQPYKVAVRVVLEQMKPTDADKEAFAALCEGLTTFSPYIDFFGGWAKGEYDKPIYDFHSGIGEQDLCDRYSSVCRVWPWLPKWATCWWPWLYARVNNKRNINRHSGSKWLFIDFI